MSARLMVAGVVAVRSTSPAAPRETRVPVGNASLYARDIGAGRLIIVLHGCAIRRVSLISSSSR
jgi:hypothetical protein